MRKALVTQAVGPAVQLLDLSLPTLLTYAQRHDYDLVVGSFDSDGRPPAWGRIPLLRRLLESYEAVVWMDADVLILDSSEDIVDQLPAEVFQGLVVANRHSDQSPLAGVWVMRADRRSREFLDTVWAQHDLVHHRLCEQAAAMRLLGWTTELPFEKIRTTIWDAGTFILREEWNMVPQHPVGYGPGKIRHYAAWSYRRRRFDMGTDLANLQQRRLRYFVGLLERRLRHRYRPILGRLRGR